MSDEFDVSGRRALVTGASRGIGRAIAVALALHGAAVAVHYAAREEQAKEVVREVQDAGGKAVCVRGDLAQLDAPRLVFEETVKALGGVDILVLNASIQIREQWDRITAEQFDEQMNVNFRSSLVLMQLAIPAMKRQKWGRVLTVGSVQQIKPHPQMAVYAATKAAQMSLVRNLSKQIASDGVTINNLAPGVIETERNAGAWQDPAIKQRTRGAIPVGFIGQAEDCVGATLLLCSDAGRYITGSDFLVDGGWSL